MNKDDDNLCITNEQELIIGGMRASELARQFSTPLYVLDAQRIKNACKQFTDTLNKIYPDHLVCYASKAFSCIGIYQLVNKQGLGADVVSAGELYTALKSGMSADKMYFHGNNKLQHELEFAIDSKVHAVVIDSFYEIGMLANIAKQKNVRQRVLVRTNPGIEAHTHQYIQTARVDSKFGFLISDGTALSAIKEILSHPSLEFVGIHCHIGSQIFEIAPFELAVEKMSDLIVDISKQLGIDVKELNMGGGYGIKYTSIDNPLPLCDYAKKIAIRLNDCIKRKNILPPRLILEPGRSIVGEAGTTLYTVGAIKDIKDTRKYISVDGGMYENPRFALYKAKYEAVLAQKMHKKPCETVTIAGKCCESGDILIQDALVPVAESGDILAVLSTGAYNYSMASNYNKNAIPPVVLVENGKADYIVKPQSYDDLIRNDCTIDTDKI